MKKKFKDYSGQFFNGIEAVFFIERVGIKTIWLCRCHCGSHFEANIKKISDGDKKSCGCVKGHFGLKNINIKQADFSKRKLFFDYRCNAHRRGFKWEISEELFFHLTSSNCFYCGSKPYSLKKAGKGNKFSTLYNGIDRKDNNNGYEDSNVVPCCKKCNFAKGKSSYYEFISYLDRLVEYRNGIKKDSLEDER